MPIKEEDQDIIISWKGEKMKVVAVSQCTFPMNGHAVVSN